MLTSVLTAYKNKKQRIKYQSICFGLQGTVLLPYLMMTVVYSTVMDTALIPCFGFAFMIPGYLKPQRGWSQITPVTPGPNSTVSDGQIYSSMKLQISAQIRKLIEQDPNCAQWTPGQIYLFKNEKMIIIVHILERGNDYVVFTMKGSELQETTVCHAEENENIN